MRVDNPYLQPPYIEGPQSRSWAQGFTYGFQGPDYSSIMPADVQTEDPDAFNQGVLVGQSAAINGIDLREACVDLNVERPHLEHIAIEISPEGVMFAGEIMKKCLRGGIFSAIMLVFEILVGLETFADDPAEGLNRGVSKLQEQLQSLGFQQGLELYIGAGADLNQPGCELQMTGVYRYQDGATNAARALGRQQWLVARWRTDQCGGATVVDYGGQ
jgi:hypothetical protein